jgi:cytochrome c-type biogenesis protein
MNTLFDGTHLSFIIVYVAGFTTFFASCLLPLVPTYLAYLAGLTRLDTSESNKTRMVLGSLYFVAGFLAVFVTLGLSINVLSNRVLLIRMILEKIGGLLFTGLGLVMLEVMHPNWLVQNRSIWNPRWFGNQSQAVPWWLQAVVAGMGFAASWTPCIGPVLAAVLYWATRSHPLQGVGLLVTYGLGLGTPFVLVSLIYQSALPVVKQFKQASWYINKVSGMFLLVMGVLMLIGQFQYVSVWLLTIFRLNTLAL